MSRAPTLGFWHARRRWRENLKLQRVARIALTAAAYSRELDRGLQRGWRQRIARELRVTVWTISRYLQVIHAEVSAAQAAGKPCPRCGCPGHHRA
ncbi:MAG: hypothetical protein KGR26_03710 [Cyanobacteria bacterium REEB65]|nr:hypothetical protein [Cyanobacteria bacterium REEB65]